MRRLKFACQQALILAAVCFISGCATSDFTSSMLKPGYGCVDLYSPAEETVYWSVSIRDKRTGRFNPLYWEMSAPKNSFLRLALSPGSHLLQITANNLAVQTPAELEVTVLAGKISPVRVEYIGASLVAAQTRDLGFGGSVKGPAGRRVRTVDRQTELYRAVASAEHVVEFQPKEKMPYSR